MSTEQRIIDLESRAAYQDKLIEDLDGVIREFSARVEKQLRKVPQHVALKVMTWVDEVEEAGLEEVRKIPGYKDHPHEYR